MAGVAVFRVDGGSGIGGGHVMRCLALADALGRAGWTSIFATKPGTALGIPTLARSPHQVVELAAPADPECLMATVPNGADLVVCDHYGLDESYERPLRRWARRIAVLDDLADRHHDCDIVLDSGALDPAAYQGKTPTGCRILSGPAYAPLAPQFHAARLASGARRLEPGRPRNVLVSFGLVDSRNCSEAAVEAVALALPGSEVTVLLGRDALEHRANSFPGTLRLLSPVDDMASRMAGADLALGAAGNTAWERCCVGLPSIAVVTAANQLGIAHRLKATGAAYVIKHSPVSSHTLATAIADACSATELQRLGRAALALCDGLGAQRAALEFAPVETKDGVAVTMRPVTMDDAAMVLEWQRHPDTRRHFRNPRPPAKHEHEAWMRARRDDPNCTLEIILRDGKPAGLLRIDHADGGDEVSILVAPEARNHGTATAALLATRRLIGGRRLIAEVQPDNVFSRASFAKAGFAPSDGAWLTTHDF